MIDVTRTSQKNGRRQNPQNGGRMGAREKNKEGEAQEKWIDRVQMGMDKYGLQLEDAEGKWKSMIKVE